MPAVCSCTDFIEHRCGNFKDGNASSTDIIEHLMFVAKKCLN